MPICYHKNIYFLPFLPLLLLVLLLSGCQTTGRKSTALPTPRLKTNQARVSVFIQLQNENGSEAWLKTSGVELISQQQTIKLAGGSTELDAAAIGGGQRFLARGPVPATTYTYLRLHLEKAALLRQGEKLLLTLDHPVVDLPLPSNFGLQPGDSRTLIISWDDKKSLTNQSRFSPVMAVQSPNFPLLANLAYISCPDIDTLYLLSTDSNRISGSLPVKGKPSYMAYSPLHKRLYILAEEQSSITVIETATNRIVDQFKIPMTSSPSFFLMTPDGKWGYILDERRGNLIRMDMSRGSMEKKVNLGYKPRYLAWQTKSERLVLSSALDQKVYFLNPETLKPQDVLLVGSNPDGLLVNDNFIYVAEQGSNTVNIFDANTLQPIKKLAVGFMPRRIIEKNNTVYVSNYRGNTISLILARGQRVARSIPVGKGAFEMALANKRKWLYVIAQQDGAITVLDQTSNKSVTSIELGTKPADILSVY